MKGLQGYYVVQPRPQKYAPDGILRGSGLQSFRPTGVHVLLQTASLVGALLILLGYAANQRGWTGPEQRWYNLVNLVGALLLLWVAIVDQRVGFIILEVVWALVSIPPLIKPPTRKTA